MNAHSLSETYAVSPQIAASDVADIAAAGFVVVICNRPDDEDPGQPSAASIRRACEAVGIAFHHIPISGPPDPDSLAAQQAAAAAADGPVFAYCRSGQRSAALASSFLKAR